MKKEVLVKKQLDAVVNRLIDTRPSAELVLRPYIINKAVSVNKEKCLGAETVDLFEFFSDANEGDFAFVEFNISSATESEAILRISESVEVFINGIRNHEFETYNGHKLISLIVNKEPVTIRIKAVCSEGLFGFEYLITSKVYNFMWAKDYLLHIRRTIPIEEYKSEDGFAVSKLYHEDMSFDGNVEYIFPPIKKVTSKKDFNVVNSGKGIIGYAYSEAVEDGILKITCCSVSKIFINFKSVSKVLPGEEMSLPVKSGDKILVKSMKSDSGWGFECEDKLLGIKILKSDRTSGDKWIMLAGVGYGNDIDLEYGLEKGICFEHVYRDEVGDRHYWSLQDGSPVRPDVNASFFAQWFYAIMVGHYGLLRSSTVTGNVNQQKYFLDSVGLMAHYYDYIQYEIEHLGIMPCFLQRSVKLDHLDPIGTIGINMAEYYFMTSDPQALNVLYALKDAITQKVPRDESGTINRGKVMWSDDTFMSVPFLVRLGKVFSHEKYFDDAYTQIRTYFDKMYMDDKGVFSHIYYRDEEAQSKVCWGRGNGWVVWAMCEFLDIVPETYKNYHSVVAMFKQMIKGVCKFQDKSGMWHNLLDMEESFIETSCSCMFLYGLLRGYNKKILDNEVVPNIEAAYKGICERAIDEQGNVFGVCKGSGCSKDWKMYEALVTVTNDDHGTGIMIAALCEYMKYLDIQERTA